MESSSSCARQASDSKLHAAPLFPLHLHHAERLRFRCLLPPKNSSLRWPQLQAESGGWSLPASCSRCAFSLLSEGLPARYPAEARTAAFRLHACHISTSRLGTHGLSCRVRIAACVAVAFAPASDFCAQLRTAARRMVPPALCNGKPQATSMVIGRLYIFYYVKLESPQLF